MKDKKCKEKLCKNLEEDCSKLPGLCNEVLNCIKKVDKKLVCIAVNTAGKCPLGTAKCVKLPEKVDCSAIAACKIDSK